MSVASEYSDESVHDDHLEHASEESSEEENGFFDMEAMEASEDSNAESDGEDSDGVEFAGRGERHYFHQFCRLPIELRQRVWEFFDPYMRADARVFDIYVQTWRSRIDLWESATLRQQLEPARTVLATHRESRHMALKFYPDCMRLARGRGFVYFHKERDVILLSGSLPGPIETWAEDVIEVQNLAIEMTFGWVGHEQEALDQRLDPRPLNLKNIYYSVDALDYLEAGNPASSLQWCVSDKVHNFLLETEEECAGVGEDAQYLYCWPNLGKHQDWAKENVLASPPDDDDDDDDDATRSLEIWPMVKFSFEEGMRLYNKLQAVEAREGKWDDNWNADSDDEDKSSDSGTDQNEYESDGIDDATLDGSEDHSDDDDLLIYDDNQAVHDVDVAEGDPDEQISTLNGFSPLQAESPELNGIDHPPAVHFSSLESESPRSGDEYDSGSDNEPLVTTARSSRRVVDSDSEDDASVAEVEEPRPKRRRGRALLSDTEDDRDEADEEEQRPAGRRVRAVAIDSEDDDDADEVEKSRHSRRRGRVVPSDDENDDNDDSPNDGNSKSTSDAEEESSEEKDDEVNDDDSAPKRQSLAERLQLFRSANPVSESDSETFANDMDGDDYDNPNFDDIQDDEEGDEDSGNDFAEELGDLDEEEW